jgi:phosphoenolpyruvate carboxylase
VTIATAQIGMTPAKRHRRFVVARRILHAKRFTAVLSFLDLVLISWPSQILPSRINSSTSPSQVRCVSSRDREELRVRSQITLLIRHGTQSLTNTRGLIRSVPLTSMTTHAMRNILGVDVTSWKRHLYATPARHVEVDP